MTVKCASVFITNGSESENRLMKQRPCRREEKLKHSSGKEAGMNARKLQKCQSHFSSGTTRRNQENEWMNTEWKWECNQWMEECNNGGRVGVGGQGNVDEYSEYYNTWMHCEACEKENEKEWIVAKWRERTVNDNMVMKAEKDEATRGGIYY